MREPDLTIGPKDNPQMERWHLFHRWGIQIALHHWHRSDSDRALHDHTAGNVSVLLTGPYREWFSHSWEKPRWKLRLPFIPYYRRATTAHRVELHKGKVWSLWIRFRPWRDWGFHCQKGWVHWRDYIAQREGYYAAGESTVEKGCG